MRWTSSTIATLATAEVAVSSSDLTSAVLLMVWLFTVLATV